MQEAILRLFDGDQNADIAFWIIVGLSFLLGMLVWALLAHWPASRKLKRAVDALEKEKNLLQKDNKELSERLAVLTTKHQHIQEEWQTTTARLQEREEQLGRQTRQITHLSEELEAHKAQARNYKQANDKLLDEYREAAQTNKALYAKLEDMKGLVEEVEQGKVNLAQDFRRQQQDFQQQQRELQDKSRELEQAQSGLKEAEADLKAALEQKAELKELVFRLEATQQVGNSSDDELRQQLIDLKTHVQELEQENSDLLERLEPYLDDDKNDEDLQELFVDLLIEAEESMNKGGFYLDFDKDELIEDPEQVRKALAEREQLETEEQAEELPIAAEEEEELDHSLTLADLAMNRKGFYAQLDEAVLLPLPPEIEQLSDEDLLKQHLNSSEKQMSDSPFYTEEIAEGDLIEQQELLEVQLKKLDVHAEPVPEEKPLELEDEEVQAMSRADYLAQEALNTAGLYAPIKAAHLIADKKHEQTVEPLDDFEQKRDLKSALQQSISNQLPTANPEARDELQAINGIGYVLERQLNDLGLYTYEQLSQLNDELIYDLNTFLELPLGTIVARQWVKQAQQRKTNA